MDLSIIIINWNSANYLRKCLETIYANTQGIEFEIIVVDNASFDGSADMLAREFCKVRFLQSRTNLGFAAANNLGFQHSSGRNILFLNPDTEIRGPALAELHERLNQLPNAGAVGCKLLNTDGTLQTSCIQSFPTILNQFLDSEFLRLRFPHSRLWGMAPLFTASLEPSVVEGISGACVMVKRDVFEGVAGFDDRYFMYAEDIDLSFKVARAGCKSYYVPSAIVIHHGGMSSKSARSAFSIVMVRESVYRFMRLRRGLLPAVVFRALLTASAAFRLSLLVVSALLRRPFSLHTSASVRKWLCILRWSLRLERWAERAGTAHTVGEFKLRCT